jgi:2-keto-3-deoxy-L-rhamnonate aldolase RhmA
MSKLNVIRRKIANGELVVGTNVSLGDCSVTELFGEAGFDFVWIDTEHTAIDRKDLLLNIMATNGTGAAAFVRVPGNDPILVKPILEMGPDGIIFSDIRNAVEAKEAVAACLYPLAGVRGFGPIRAIKYGQIEKSEYISKISRDIWKVMQIEHREAVDNLEEIMAVAGVDAIVVGPNDLSGSIGLLGQTEHPEVKRLMDTIAKKAKQVGKPFGVTMGYNPPVNREWLDRGVNFIAAGGDFAYLMNGGTEALNGVRKLYNAKNKIGSAAK